MTLDPQPLDPFVFSIEPKKTALSRSRQAEVTAGAFKS
jgi:hypothetical protein